MLAVAADRRAGSLGQRAVVLDDAFQRFPGQVEPVEFGVAMLQRGHDAQGLRVVVEAAMGLQAGIQRPLAGMAERRMAEVVRQRQGFRQVLVEARAAGPARGRSAPLPAYGSAGCGNDRPRGTRKPGFCASGGETPWNGSPGRNRAGTGCGSCSAARRTAARGCGRGRRHRPSEEQPFRPTRCI